MDTLQVIHYLKQCSGAELNKILNESLSEREEIESGNGLITRLILCHAVCLEDKTSPYYEGWVFHPVADKDPKEYGEDELGEPFSQSGYCEVCDVEVDSHVKRAVCPLCGSQISCT